MNRTTIIDRQTKETKIRLSMDLDGKGEVQANTGIGFLDHMLTSFGKHGFFDLDIKVTGDLAVDGHHTVEDTGIVLGQAIKNAVGDKKGIKRYGHCILPMDDALILCAIDLCGRPYLSFEASIPAKEVGELQTELVEEFFYAVSYKAGMNLHIKMLSGKNSHHIIEGMFKAFGKALDQGVSREPRLSDVLSTKGSFD